LSEMENAPADTSVATPEVVAPESPSTMPAINLERAVMPEGLSLEPSPRTNTGGITITYTDVKLADMVRVFAQASGANIIIPEGLDMPVSGNLNDVQWKEALEVILEEKGFILLERKTGIFMIIPRERMASEPLANETITLRFIKSEDAMGALEGMTVSSNSSIRAVPNANVIRVTETAQQIQEIKKVLEIVDQPRKQVFIEAKFVELNDSAIKDLGINWQVLQGYTVRATGMSTEYKRTDTRTSQDAQALVTSRTNSSSSTRTRTDDLLMPGVEADSVGSLSSNSSGGFEGVVQGKNFDSFDAAEGTMTTIPSMQQDVVRSAILSADDFALTLSALQQLDGVRIVSNPKMLVANGQTATIHVGRNEPNIRAIPQGENATTFAYVLDGFIEIGVKLEVTPVISTAKNITVSIIPELSRLLGEKIVGEAGTSFPITQIRRINTEFALESGRTVAIGGLTQGEEKEIVKKVPLLGDLPIIGKYLFRHTRTINIQDEIIIFVSVNMAHTEEIQRADGIPGHGKLINTWMEHNPGPAAK
jgi:type IV pilus assembly protein PilQ